MKLTKEEAVMVKRALAHKVDVHHDLMNRKKELLNRYSLNTKEYHDRLMSVLSHQKYMADNAWLLGKIQEETKDYYPY